MAPYDRPRTPLLRSPRANAAVVALAEELAHTKNKTAIRELAEHLQAKNKRLVSDCLKTLYEVGAREPKLISKYVDDFAALLTSKTQRHVWGAMTALSAAVLSNPEAVHAHLDQILNAAEGESIIARDHAVKILCALSASDHYDNCFPKLLAIVRTAPINQWPTYAEEAAAVIQIGDASKLACIIEQRMPEITEHNTKTLRMQRLLKKL